MDMNTKIKAIIDEVWYNGLDFVSDHYKITCLHWKQYDLSKHVTFFNKPTKTLGLASFDFKTLFKLSFNEHYIHNLTDNDLKTIVTHEVSHVLACIVEGDMKHSKVWKNIDRKMGGSGMAKVRLEKRS